MSTPTGDLDMKTRFVSGQVHLLGTTFRRRRAKSLDQHTLTIENVPTRPLHGVPDKVNAHPARPPSTTYKVINQPPDRVYGQVERTKTGGESLVQDQYMTWWDRGEFWNRDSNIQRWNFQEVRRKAAQGAHDVHRYDQINHERLAADRENPVDMFTTWIPPRYFDKYDPKPGAAQNSCGIHNQQSRKNTEYGWCFDGDMVRPTAIYTKKFQKMGEDAFRKRGVWQV
eukprot:CAMPEP_0178994722 /NCGR_PEP_ID=MMETSP0795-20121207/7427_1 /TAXON_ID=88552 /ORGANISM="Amoebophrya sp., Strain Ameob2" /LENGTH=225 /DNA_ID=CAMNT_0020686945 /DNA_START=229 /DNA_END=906 /DNA_ORIENTATION=+